SAGDASGASGGAGGGFGAGGGASLRARVRSSAPASAAARPTASPRTSAVRYESASTPIGTAPNRTSAESTRRATRPAYHRARRRSASLGRLLSDAPVALEGPADVVTRRVGHDELGARSRAVDDRVLTKGAPDVDRFVPVDAVDEPGRLAPHAVWVFVVADAVLHAISAEDEQIAEDLVARLVDPPRQEHAPRVVGREQREVSPEDLRERGHVFDELSVERRAHDAVLGGKLVNGREIGTQLSRIHAAELIARLLRS